MIARHERLFVAFAEACGALGAADRAYDQAYRAAEEASPHDLAARLVEAERAHADLVACERRATRLAELFTTLTGRIVDQIGAAPPVAGPQSR